MGVGAFAPSPAAWRPRAVRMAAADERPSDLTARARVSKTSTRRAFLIAAAGACVAAATFGKPDEAEALGLAPTPINPYARRRREKAYKEYMKAVEESIESVSVFDMKKLVESGGGGLGVSYKVAGLAAATASAMSTAVVHPIDSIKTRMQARSALGPDEPRQPLFQNLYMGVGSNMLKEAPNSAIYLAIYEFLKTFLMGLSVTSFFHDVPLVTFAIAGAMGDAIGSVVRVPAEIVNKRLQLGLSATFLEAVKDAFFSANGRESTTVAWKAILLRDVPYGGIQIALYECGKQFLATHALFLGGMLSEPGLYTDVVVGACAGAIAAMVTTPADVIVTRLSMQNPQCYLEEKAYMGVRSTARRIIQNEGVGGLFNGMFQRGVYFAPLIGLFFALYGANRDLLEHPESAIVALSAAQQYLQNFLISSSHALSSGMPYLTGGAWFVSEHLVPLLVPRVLRG